MLDDYSSFYVKHMGTVSPLGISNKSLSPYFTSKFYPKRVQKISGLQNFIPQRIYHFSSHRLFNIISTVHLDPFPLLQQKLFHHILEKNITFFKEKKSKLDPNQSFQLYVILHHPPFRKGVEILAPLVSRHEQTKVSLTRAIIKRVRREIATRVSSRSNWGKYGNTQKVVAWVSRIPGRIMVSRHDPRRVFRMKFQRRSALLEEELVLSYTMQVHSFGEHI